MDQIVILSDGSAYKQLTTSPKGVIRSTKDVRNHPMWNPSIQKLMDVEEDDAGKLSAFRERYGRGFDNKEASAAAAEAAEIVSGKKDDGKKADEEEVDYLMDLISSGYIRPPGGASEKKQGKK